MFYNIIKKHASTVIHEDDKENTEPYLEKPTSKETKEEKSKRLSAAIIMNDIIKTPSGAIYDYKSKKKIN